ncbi:prepilin peptidase [Candidatus Pacearchaeota archaeon]|nr:prepilin peptidase [Candidatus Pacearchaeota archaeon]
MILAEENLFLIVLAVVWIIGAIMQDMKRREVDNIWNFSLLLFALAYRLAYSIHSQEYWFFVNGILGLIVFVVLGNLFYYSQVFAGGDAKLLIALGGIMPLSYDWIINLKLFGSFIGLFLFGGAVYVLFFALVLVCLHWKKFSMEFIKRSLKIKTAYIFGFLLFLIWAIISFFIGTEVILFGVIFILFPILLAFSKAVEESCLIVNTPLNKITEGDWLYKDITVGGKKIKAHWEGLSKQQLIFIQKKHRGPILIKQGIPFTPSFLIGLIGIILLDYWWGWF